MGKGYTITESELQAHADNYDGICMHCGSWTDGGVEPDASGYACEECGKPCVVGAEMAMIAGGLTFVAEDTESL
jgi:hypothetical protein